MMGRHSFPEPANIMAGIPMCLVSVFFFTVVFSIAARAQVLCEFTQITENSRGIGDRLAISGDGSRIAFDSLDDITDGNADGSAEVFLYDEDAGIIQITDTIGLGAGLPTLNGDGTLISFQSINDLVPPMNADGNYEIFLYDTVAGAFTQITDTMRSLGGPFNSNIGASISSDGMRIAFTSDRNFVGTNADENNEMFYYDFTIPGFVQVTNTTVESNIGTICSDGSTIVFRTLNDITGGNTDGTNEVFSYDAASTVTTQITNTSGAEVFSGTPDADASRLVIATSHDLTGDNPDGNREIFLFDEATGFSQLTDSDGGPNFGDSVNAAGNVIAFYSRSDLKGENPDENIELYVYETDSMHLTQVTDTTGGNVIPGPSATNINAEGDRIVFESDRDLTGDNPGEELVIFRADCVPDSDDDGIADEDDACPESDTGENIVIDGCDSGVENVLGEDGCTISDSIGEIAGGASNHGKFVSGVSHLLNGLKKDGVISGADKGAVQSCASQAGIP